MFPALGLFKGLHCPEIKSCQRHNCAFSHDATRKPPNTVHIPVAQSAPLARKHRAPTPPAASNAGGPSVTRPVRPGHVTPAKRTVTTQAAGASAPPPTKTARVGPAHQSKSITTATATLSGAPTLRVNPAMSKVPIIVRQAMLKTLYEEFEKLYTNIKLSSPHLASEHALKQEQQIYDESSQHTYRNSVVHALVQLKSRERPTNLLHAAVGTSAEIKAREETKKKFQSLTLTKAHLDPLVLSQAELSTWGYMVELPDGPGGNCPSEEGRSRACERCGEKFEVRRASEGQQCTFHHGKLRSVRIEGARDRKYTCCHQSEGVDGCTTGKHVFYEQDPELLHARHAFTPTRPPTPKLDGSTASGSTALDLCCLDCEMVYTTGGMSIARVSVVDGSGKEIFDELVRLDDNVELIDYNTRFSGILEETHSKAKYNLDEIRRNLDTIINSNTIIVGHALDNDLKALRMIHHRCVDTVALYPHNHGPPYRRSLRDLVKEHLGQVIQTGGASVGHSSVEDSIATLDLVRFYVINNKGKAKPPIVAPLVARSAA